MILDNQIELKQVRKHLFQTLEDARREADARYDGLLRTEDAKFAYAMVIALSDTLHFLDSYMQKVDKEIEELQYTIDNKEEELDRLNGQIQEALEWIKDATRLRKIEEILRHHR